MIFDKYSKLLAFTPSDVGSTEVKYSLEPKKNIKIGEKYHNTRIFYITDIHLDHKIDKKFTFPPSKSKLRMYISGIADKLANDFLNNEYRSKLLLIGGDVSFQFNNSRIFYEELVKRIGNWRIVVILGNHELWSVDSPNDDLEARIDRYRCMFDEMNISFIQNDVFALENGSPIIMRERDIMSANDEEIQEMFTNCPVVILGSIGFSGYNPKYNASSGMYRDAIKNCSEDLDQTQKFESLYNRMQFVLSKQQVVVLTHTPMESWTQQEHNPNWIYVSGHTHRNEITITDGMTVYSDNQIGYHSKNIHLKSFNISNDYDIFKYYSDGIYEITKIQYCDFYRNLSLPMNFNRDGQVIMLKRNGYYCFFLKNESGKTYLLNGGRIKSISNFDLNYYYSNMQIYTEIIENYLKTYNDKLKMISDDIKKIEGDGKIHGCIVDIDFYNHIYLNPFDDSITPYYATDTVDKKIYRNVASILYYNCPTLYQKYVAELNSPNPKGLIPYYDNKVSNETIWYGETDIYRISGVIKSFQYATNCHIIRIWNDSLLKSGDLESQKALIKNLLDADDEN